MTSQYSITFHLSNFAGNFLPNTETVAQDGSDYIGTDYQWRHAPCFLYLGRRILNRKQRQSEERFCYTGGEAKVSTSLWWRRRGKSRAIKEPGTLNIYLHLV